MSSNQRRLGLLAATLAILWLTVAYALVTTSLIECSENRRFHFESRPWCPCRPGGARRCRPRR